MIFAVGMLFCLLPLACLRAQSASDAPATAAYESDAKYLDAMKQGKDLIHQRQYFFALDAYKKANKAAGGQSLKCLDEIYALQMGMKSYKDAIATAAQLLAIAKSPMERSIAESDQGQALLKQAGDKAKPAQLEAVHTAMQAAIADYHHNNSALYADACVLARMGKNDDASKEFEACAKNARASDPMRVRAQHFAENPALSLSKMAPAFEVTALDGTRFNLDNMGGRVVLIDFWATWCGPCNEELPNVKKIVRDFAGQPLVVISISWDSDADKWKSFIAKNEMTWLQYRDADHKLSDEFGVQAIPHYFTIDSDGVLTAEVLGSGNDVEGKLRKLVKRANDAKSLTMASTQ